VEDGVSVVAFGTQKDFPFDDAECFGRGVYFPLEAFNITSPTGGNEEGCLEGCEKDRHCLYSEECQWATIEIKAHTVHHKTSG
jgi:hypothetical protein